MKKLQAALQFITILPVGKSADFRPDQMIPLFPVVGLIIGTLLALFDSVLMRIWPDPVVAVLDVLFLVTVTGAFHIDGLADAADGLFSHRPRERVLEIMKDSRVGTMGIVAIVGVLAGKWAGIGAMTDHRVLALIIVPAYARAGMIFGIRVLKYGRPEGGTGADFFSDPLPFSSFAWFLLPVFLSIFLGFRCVLLNAAFAATVAGMLLYYKRRLNGITGDMLGAMAEVTEAVLFLTLAAGTGF
ncbi:MAG: adenosylcobinamide-GDP ribazoletransferase [Deltaproteobacteria bacterium]|nr:MAG: adenosylcobinamide-GDP ribazoletransferase [Deltaproteobacteria bacterium]